MTRSIYHIFRICYVWSFNQMLVHYYKIFFSYTLSGTNSLLRYTIMINLMEQIHKNNSKINANLNRCLFLINAMILKRLQGQYISRKEVEFSDVVIYLFFFFWNSLSDDYSFQISNISVINIEFINRKKLFTCKNNEYR